MRKPMLVLALVVACLSVIAAGCGGDDDNDNNASNSSGAQGNGANETQSTTTSESTSGGGGGGGATKLKLTADPGGALKFDKTELSAKPGKVTVTMDNPSSVPHAVEIEGNGVEEETKTLTDGTASVTVDLKAGNYEFYCPVDGHKEAGMKGTLTVG
jgi:plastocyanin